MSPLRQEAEPYGHSLRDVFSAESLCLREMVPQEYASLILCDGMNSRIRLHALDFPETRVR